MASNRKASTMQGTIPGLAEGLTPEQALVHVRAEGRCHICGLGPDLCTGALPEELHRARQFIERYAAHAASPGGRRRGWSWATSMPDHPHEYAVRERCQLVDQRVPHPTLLERDFEWFVALIRQRGYQRKYGSTTYTYLNIEHDDGTVWRYWSMGWPVDQTLIINRTPVQPEGQAALKAANVKAKPKAKGKR